MHIIIYICIYTWTFDDYLNLCHSNALRVQARTKLRFHIFSWQFLREVSHKSFVFTSSAVSFWEKSRTKASFSHLQLSVLREVSHESFVFTSSRIIFAEITWENWKWFRPTPKSWDGLRRGETTRNETKRDEMTWKHLRKHDMRWNEMRWDWMRRDVRCEMKSGENGSDEMRWNWMKWNEVRKNPTLKRDGTRMTRQELAAATHRRLGRTL